MKTPVHIDSDARTIVDADGRHIVVLMTAGTHADLERIESSLNTSPDLREALDSFDLERGGVFIGMTIHGDVGVFFNGEEASTARGDTASEAIEAAAEVVAQATGESA